jgi:hypothetical protein
MEGADRRSIGIHLLGLPNMELSSRADSKRMSQFCRQLKATVEAGLAADCSNDLLAFTSFHTAFCLSG